MKKYQKYVVDDYLTTWQIPTLKYQVWSEGDHKNGIYDIIPTYKNRSCSWAVAAHAFNPSTWEAEAVGFLSSRPAWSTE